MINIELIAELLWIWCVCDRQLWESINHGGPCSSYFRPVRCTCWWKPSPV